MLGGARLTQESWERAIKLMMEQGGWTLDRDDETHLGFHFIEGDAKWIKDYDKKTRSFVQFNGNQVVNLVQTKTKGNSRMEEFKPPESMNLFFKRLHALKNSVKAASESHPDQNVQIFALSIYQELHELYKTEEEHENSDCTSSCSDA